MCVCWSRQSKGIDECTEEASSGAIGCARVVLDSYDGPKAWTHGLASVRGCNMSSFVGLAWAFRPPNYQLKLACHMSLSRCRLQASHDVYLLILPGAEKYSSTCVSSWRHTLEPARPLRTDTTRTQAIRKVGTVASHGARHTQGRAPLPRRTRMRPDGGGGLAMALLTICGM